MKTFRQMYTRKPNLMKTLHDSGRWAVWHNLIQIESPPSVYSTDASNAPVSTVVPCFICTKIL
jgi:hypothetical protein